VKIELQLDYKTILRNSAQPIYLVARLSAPEQPLTQRARPTAFQAAFDRAGQSIEAGAEMTFPEAAIHNPFHTSIE
jgi:hypothetical protein